MNTYDNFMVNEIMPSIKTALKKEDNSFRIKMNKSKFPEFYKPDVRGISSYVLTERTLQYIIFKELCGDFKIIPEYLSYGNSLKRIDLVIFKNISDYEKTAEIGVEIKTVGFSSKGLLRAKSIEGVIEDFIKIKEAQNKNKYLLLIGSATDVINNDLIEQQFLNEWDNKIFRYYSLKSLCVESFKVESDDAYDRLNILLFKVNKIKN